MKKNGLIKYKKNFFSVIIEKIKNILHKTKKTDILDEMETDGIHNFERNNETIDEKKTYSAEIDNENKQETLNYEDLNKNKVDSLNENKETIDGIERYKTYFFDTYNKVKDGKVKISELNDLDLLFVNRFLYEEAKQKKD